MNRLFGKRFRPDRLLKAARGVETFAGIDEESGAAVVIKVAREGAVASGARQRLAHEATVLAAVKSEWVAPLVGFGSEDGALFVVTAMVQGAALASRIAKGPLSVSDAMTVGRGLFAALDVVHGEGVLHRDVKPENVVVEEGAGDSVRRAVLVDFGFARSADLESSIRDLPVGTLRTISPEQAGLLDRGVDTRSDLYSAGVVLFECLAGRPPFLADNVGDLLREHLTAHPPEIRSVGVGVPRALDEIIQRLLKKDPRDRYQSAAAVVADLDDLSDALARGIAEPAMVVGKHDRRRTLTEPAFVGREEDLAAIDAALESGKGGMVLVEAASGGGKSRLLDEVAQRASRRGSWVLRGRALDQAGQRPFQILDSPTREVVETARAGKGQLLVHLRARLGDDREAAAAALPDLAPVLGGAMDAGRDRTMGALDAYGETRTIRALSAFLDSLGQAERPAVILLDDVQWADELTLKLLAAWQRHHAERETRMTVVAAFRSEEVPEGHILRSVVPTTHVTLPRMSSDLVRLLAESMAGPLPSEAIELVTRLAEGSPFLAVAVLQGLVETGALVDVEGGWRAEPFALATVQASRRAAAVMTRRIDLMPTTTRRFLSVGAVIGREFDLAFAAQLSETTAEAAVRALNEARRRQIVWLDAAGARATFVHDKLRDALLERLSRDERRWLHRVVAERIEEENPKRVFDLAYHFDCAGDAARALPFALAAAEAARAQYSLAIAERNYRIAANATVEEGREPEVPADRAIRLRVEHGLAEVLMLRGRYNDAEPHFIEALSLCTDRIDRARIEGEIGELVFKRGDVRGSADAISRAIRSLGHPVPRSTVGFAVRLVKELVAQGLHALFPRLFLARRSLDVGAADLLAAFLYHRLAYAFYFFRGIIPTVWCGFRHLNLAERYPATRELGQALSNTSVVWSLLARHRWSARFTERAQAVRKEIGDTWGLGNCHHFRGVNLYAESRFAEGIESLREAIRSFDRTGDRWEANDALINVAFCQYRLGDLREAEKTARLAFACGQEIGEDHGRAHGVELWSKTTGGAIPAAVIEEEWARPTANVQGRTAIMQGKAVALIREGRIDEAIATLSEADMLVRKSGLRNEYLTPIPAFLATALRIAAERAPAHSTSARSDFLARARSAARRAGRLSRWFRNNVPHVERELGLVAALEGRPRKARAHFDASLREAERQGAKAERAMTLLARGKVGRDLKWSDAAEDLQLGLEAIRATGAVMLGDPAEEEAPQVTLSLADRFATVLDEGRRIAASLTEAAAFEAVRDAAMKLLRGESCVVHRVEEATPNIVRVAGDEDAADSVTLVRRAISSGRPIIETRGLGGGVDASDSMLLSEARSAICAPIFVRGRPAATFTATHRHVGGLFGGDEERLAAFIAALAGAALENAAGFAEVEALSKTLEKRVEERTRALSAANRDLETSLAKLRETQGQLIQAGKMAAVGTLVAGLSHELNNPVGVILGFAQVVEQRMSPDDPSLAAVQSIAREAKRCADLVRALLDFSRRSPSTRLAVSLTSVVSRAVHLASGHASRRSVTLTHATNGDGLPMVRVSPVEIESAVLNLVANAIDATPEGGSVTVRTRALARDEAPGVEIAVIDTGAGIPEEILPRIFEPFFTTKPVGKGTGLGLSLARQIVAAHGGEIVAESAPAPAHGTTMRIWLPVAAERERDGAADQEV